jgi:hypothetical protein
MKVEVVDTAQRVLSRTERSRATHVSIRAVARMKTPYLKAVISIALRDCAVGWGPRGSNSVIVL